MAEKIMTMQPKSAVSAPVVGNDESWGSEGANPADMLIPRLHLMQAISKAVKNDKAKAGDIIHSVDGTVLCPKGKKLEIVPISTFSEWEISDVHNGKATYRSRVARNATNENLPTEDFEDGLPIKRVRVLNFFVLVVQDIDGLPYLVKFRSSSYPTGKKLSTHFQVSAMKRQPPAAQVFALGSQLESRDGNDYYVSTLDAARKTTPAELEKARSWYLTLKTSQVRFDEEQKPVASVTEEEVPF